MKPGEKSSKKVMTSGASKTSACKSRKVPVVKEKIESLSLVPEAEPCDPEAVKSIVAFIAEDWQIWVTNLVDKNLPQWTFNSIEWQVAVTTVEDTLCKVFRRSKECPDDVNEVACRLLFRFYFASVLAVGTAHTDDCAEFAARIFSSAMGSSHSDAPDRKFGRYGTCNPMSPYLQLRWKGRNIGVSPFSFILDYQAATADGGTLPSKGKKPDDGLYTSTADRFFRKYPPASLEKVCSVFRALCPEGPDLFSGWFSKPITDSIIAQREAEKTRGAAK